MASLLIAWLLRGRCCWQPSTRRRERVRQVEHKLRRSRIFQYRLYLRGTQPEAETGAANHLLARPAGKRCACDPFGVQGRPQTAPKSVTLYFSLSIFSLSIRCGRRSGWLSRLLASLLLHIFFL